MIRFETRDRETGKTESYTKEDVITGEAEKCYEYLELVNQENKKEVPNVTKTRQKEQRSLVDLFKDEGLTEEDVLGKVNTKIYTKTLQDIFREINGEDEEDSETEPEEMGKTEEQFQQKTSYRTSRRYNVSVRSSMDGH